MLSTSWLSCAAVATIAAAPLWTVAAESPLDRPINASWSNVKLVERLGRLESAGFGVGFRDRRVDPRLPLNVTANGTLGLVLSKAVTPSGYGVSHLGQVVYVGPQEASTHLRTLAAINRQQITKLPADRRRPLRRVDSVAWPRLTEPRKLIESLVLAHGVKLTNPHAVPHDVWDAGGLPALSLSDRLTLLLVGFDLTWKPSAREGEIDLVRIGYPLSIKKTYRGGGLRGLDRSQFEKQHANAKLKLTGASAELTGTVEVHEALAALLRGSEQRAGGGGGNESSLANKRLTLTVRRQPALAVLQHLAKQLNLKVGFAAGAEETTRLALGQRVDLSVEQAKLEDLLDAIGRQIGLDVRLSGSQILCGPADKQ